MGKLAIFGTSGFAHETADIADACGFKDIVLLAKDKCNADKDFQVFPESMVDELFGKGYQFSIGISDTHLRKKISGCYFKLPYINLVHPTATLGRGINQQLSRCKGIIISAGVVFTSNVLLGNFSIFHMNSTIGHDSVINDYVSIMPGANISGNVYLSEGVFVGAGAVVLQGSADQKMFVGKNSIIGAASLVNKPVEENVVVMGVPARIKK